MPRKALRNLSMVLMLFMRIQPGWVWIGGWLNWAPALQRCM
jgi:hypothetical protein